VEASSSVVPAPVLDLTQPFQPSGSPDAPSSPTQSPTPVEPNVPVVDPSNEPSQDSDKAKNGTMIVVACVALVLILMMTGILLYRRSARRRQDVKSAGTAPSLQSQPLCTSEAAERSQPLLASSEAEQDANIEASAVGVQSLYPHYDPPVLENENPLARARAEPSPILEQQPGTEIQRAPSIANAAQLEVSQTLPGGDDAGVSVVSCLSEDPAAVESSGGLFEAEEQGVAEEATAAERNADDGTAAGVAHAGDARSQEDQGTTAEGDYAAARELQQTRMMKEMADRVAGGVITDWEGDKPQAATRKEDDTASTVLLAQTIAGLDQKEPAGTKSAEETAAPDPMTAIFSDSAPVPNSSSEGFAAELFQKSIVHSSPRHSPLAAEGRPAHGAGAGAGDGLGASISLPRVAIEDASAEAGASALTPRALDELVFMAAKDFAQPATVEDRILDPGSPMKRDVKPDEFKYLQQDTQQAAIIEDLLRTKKIEEAGSTDKSKKQIAQHLADLRKRGVLQDVSSELGFFIKQSAKEVDHTAETMDEQDIDLRQNLARQVKFQTTKRKFAVAKESPPAPRAVAAGSYLQSSFSPAARAPSASPPPRLPSADFASVPVLAAADQTLGSESEVPEVESAEAEQQAGKEETLPLVQSVNPPEIKETVKERLMRFEQASSSAASRLPASQRPTKAVHKHAQLFENQ